MKMMVIQQLICLYDDVEPTKQVDEELSVSPVEPQLSRSIRERKLLARYSSTSMWWREIFFSGDKISSIRVALGLAARLNLEVEQLDVETAFLHGDLQEQMYMQQTERVDVKEKEV